MTHFKDPPKKSLGQHFLHERGVIEKIVLAVDPQPGDRLFEIGPGQGAITFPLLDRHHELTVIEFDRDLIAPLTEASKAQQRSVPFVRCSASQRWLRWSADPRH